LFFVVWVVRSFGGVEDVDEGALEDMITELKWIRLHRRKINGAANLLFESTNSL
jgi:hypothetical protein